MNVGSFDCPLCGGPLFHDFEDADPEILWFECCDCGETFDLDSVHLADGKEAT